MVWGTTKNFSAYLAWRQMPSVGTKVMPPTLSTDLCSRATHFASHLPKKQHFTDLAITSTYLKVVSKRLGAGESLSVLNDALFMKKCCLFSSRFQLGKYGNLWLVLLLKPKRITCQTQECLIRGVSWVAPCPPSKDVLKFWLWVPQDVIWCGMSCRCN